MTAVYRSPSTCSEQFVLELKPYLEQINRIVLDNHIFIGDINLNINQENEIVFDYMNILSENNFVSLINKNTRIQGGSASCIDHIFLKSRLNDIQKECLPIVLKSCITDHFSTILSLPLQTENNSQKETYTKFINYKNLKTDLEKYNWDAFYSINDVEIATTFFVKLLTDKIQENTKLNKLKRVNIKRKPWITTALIQSINKKNDLYKKYRENPLVYKDEFINYRNHLNHLIKVTKIDYFKTKIDKNKSSSKNLWNVIRTFDSNTNYDIKQIMTENNELSDNELIMSNTFNNYYVGVGRNLAEKIIRPITPPPPRQSVPHSLFLHATNFLEVINLIKDLKPNKAPGIDMIKSETLKEISQEIATPLSYLINKILRTGICPAEFKKTVIKPIYKKGDKNIAENYRPISLITCLAKIFEKVIKIRLTNYIDKYKLLSPKQFGFRKGKSTQDAISCLTSEIYKAMDEGKPSLCVFLDLSKAFDTVSHRQLLEALEDIGIRGTTYNLMKSYLTQRKQCVKIKTETSDLKTIDFGVPQGTVLGPLLFTIYLNNLFMLHTSGTVISFADDTAIFYKDTSWENLKRKSEIDLCNIFNWFNHKILTINYEKTKFISFASYKNNLPLFETISIANDQNPIQIVSTDHIKYLGITIDQHLRWDIHMTNTIKLLRSILYRFKYFRKFLDINHMKIIYFALVESRLQYAILGWGGVAASHLKKLETLQKLILKIMFYKEKTYPTDLLYKETNILDIRQLFFISIVTYLHKNKHVLQTIDHDHATRQKSHSYVKTITSSKSIGQRSFAYLSARVYNFLPEELKLNIVTLNSMGLLKNKLKKFLSNTNRTEIHSLIEANYN